LNLSENVGRINSILVFGLPTEFDYRKKNIECFYDISHKDTESRKIFITWQLFPCLERSIILKRISFHFTLPSLGLRAEVARRWWLSPW